MKHLLLYTVSVLTMAVFAGCKKYGYGNYPGAEVNPYIPIYDLKSVFKGTAVTLSAETMFGSESVAGVVISDHSGNNLPAGFLVLQDRRRLSQLRGIAINVGEGAANFVPGDSVHVKIAGGKLERVEGMLQVTGVNSTAVTKVASGRPVLSNIIGSVAMIAANPDVYESTVITLTQVEFNPPATSGETFSGTKVINNGSGDFNLYTQTNAAFASKPLPFSATLTGLLFRNNAGFSMWPRTANDIIVLSDKPPVITPIIITGFLADAIGVDANYEYIQMMATRDIDFAQTPMSVVTNNNAGATTPGGIPVMGWATGGTLLNGSSRTYKIDMKLGKVTKGSYFYVGGHKLINGVGSTDISDANWIVSKMYADAANNVGYGDGFGTPTTNLLANSGNLAGIAVFNTINVDSSTVPVDVIMYGGGGNFNFSPGPPAVGYKITNTDYYETQNTAVQTLDPQPFYLMGTNSFRLAFPVAVNFAQLKGTYNVRSGKWPVKRTLVSIPTGANGTLSQIEGGSTLSEDR